MKEKEEREEELKLVFVYECTAMLRVYCPESLLFIYQPQALLPFPLCSPLTRLGSFLIVFTLTFPTNQFWFTPGKSCRLMFSHVSRLSLSGLWSPLRSQLNVCFFWSLSQPSLMMSLSFKMYGLVIGPTHLRIHLCENR